MSHHASFWQRVGGMFRGGQPAREDGNGRGNGARVVKVPSEEVSEVPPKGRTAEGSSPGLLARLGRREPTVHQMRDGYQRILEMMDGLEEHFRKQDERAAQLGAHADRMVNILEQVAESGRSQQEHIGSIAEQVAQAGQHAAVMSEVLSEMPDVLRGEAEAVRSMVRQMEVSQESDAQLMHSLQKLTQAVDGLKASGAAQVQTLERLDAAEREQREALTTLVRDQARRFLVIIVIAAILGLGALAALVTVLALRLGA